MKENKPVAPDISIVIVNWNTKALLLDCIESIYRTCQTLSYDIWLVDNASIDGSVPAVRSEFPDVHIIENEKNLGFAAANNRAFKRMQGRYCLLLNTDTIVKEGAIKRLYDFMEQTPDAAMACGQLLNPDGSKQNSIANFPSLLTLVSNETLLRILWPSGFPSKRRHYDSPLIIDSCIGACMIVRKDAMDQVGYLDEVYFFFFEETDWAYRMKQQGWQVYFVPDAKIIHAQGKSAAKRADARIMFYRSRYIYFKRWHPNSYRLVRMIIFSRLSVNFLFSLLGICFTLGMSDKLNNKAKVYFQLILWHLQGCP